MKKLALHLILLTLLTTTHLHAKISTTDRCKSALELMGYDVSGTNRGWAALCAGVLKGDKILRYGNWYGPGYWGGSNHPTKVGHKAPIDSLDEIAMRHDYGYVIAQKYGKIYGKAYEYKLKGIADKIAVEESMALPKDPTKWAKPPKDPTKTARYRDRIITGFIMESDIYKGLGNAIIIDGVLKSPIKTLMDETDYSHLPNQEELKREVKSHINGWHKEVNKAKEEKAKKETIRKAKLEAKMKKIAEKKRKEEQKNSKPSLKKRAMPNAKKMPRMPKQDCVKRLMRAKKSTKPTKPKRDSKKRLMRVKRAKVTRR